MSYSKGVGNCSVCGKHKAVVCDDCFVESEQLKDKVKKWDEHAANDSWSELREKAKELDYLKKCHPMITATEIDELKENAKNWDNFNKNFTYCRVCKKAGDHYQSNERIHTKCVDMIEEKAEKWDWFEHDKELGETLSQMIVKAKKWKEKAQKYDTIHTNWDATIEKAKNWDDVCSNNHPTKTLLLTDSYLEYTEKARKWDEWNDDRTFKVETVGMTYIDTKRFESLKDKAKKWDSVFNEPDFYKRYDEYSKKAERSEALLKYFDSKGIPTVEIDETIEKAKKFEELVKYLTTITNNS